MLFVEPDTRQDAGYMVSLEWERDTSETQIVVADLWNASQIVFRVPGAKPGASFRHPCRYAP